MKSYKQGVLDCMHIMGDLFDTYGDYNEAQSMYFEFSKRAKQLIKSL